ncbi:MAG: hypothetical protein WAV00_15395 [Nocardioides sp.]
MDADSPPSRTALAAARHRAAHQLLEGGAIFTDPLAVPILGEGEDAVRGYDGDRRMRLFVCALAWYAERPLADAASDRRHPATSDPWGRPAGGARCGPGHLRLPQAHRTPMRRAFGAERRSPRSASRGSRTSPARRWGGAARRGLRRRTAGRGRADHPRAAEPPAVAGARQTRLATATTGWAQTERS